VARTGRIPRELTKRPFSLREAEAAGLTLTALRGRSWRRISRGLYCSAALREDPWSLLVGWQYFLPREVVFAGLTAAWLHGLDVDAIHPVEVIVPSDSGARTRAGLVVRHSDVTDAITVRGFRVTNVDRTLRDVCPRLPAVEALVLIDAAVHARLMTASELMTHRRLRALAQLAEAAESPMETRLRWLLLQAGLPRPEVQTDLRNAEGRFIGRADLYYPWVRLVIEYDGTNHRDRLTEDNRRQNLLLTAGFRLLRFTAADLKHRPDFLVAQVQRALARV